MPLGVPVRGEANGRGDGVEWSGQGVVSGVQSRALGLMARLQSKQRRPGHKCYCTDWADMVGEGRGKPLTSGHTGAVVASP